MCGCGDHVSDASADGVWWVGGHARAGPRLELRGTHPQQDAQCAVELRRADLDVVAEHRLNQLDQRRGRLDRQQRGHRGELCGGAERRVKARRVRVGWREGWEGVRRARRPRAACMVEWAGVGGWAGQAARAVSRAHQLGHGDRRIAVGRDELGGEAPARQRLASRVTRACFHRRRRVHAQAVEARRQLRLARRSLGAGARTQRADVVRDGPRRYRAQAERLERQVVGEWYAGSRVVDEHTGER